MSSIREKEDHLETLRIDEAVAEKEMSIAEKKAKIAQYKEAYGPSWRKVLYGAVKGLTEKTQTSRAAMGKYIPRKSF